MITDDAILGTTKAAYFPDGMKVSQVPGTGYFQGAAPESAPESECESDSDGTSSGSSEGSNPDPVSDADGLSSCSALSTDSDSEDETPTEVVWAKSARGVWGWGNFLGTNCPSHRIFP